MSFKEMVKTNKELVKNVELIGNNLLVHIQVPEQFTKTESGIIVDEKTAKEIQKDVFGDVLVVGEEVEAFKVGDRILLPPHGNTPVSVGGEVFHVFRETSLFGKIKK